MPLSWNEIRHRAIRFSKEWTDAKREQAEKQTFWNEFFDVFGVSRRAVASFEAPVRSLSGDFGYIDLFWSGTVLVEHKSRGKNLGKAESQAFRYIQDLARAGRTNEIPRYVIVSDFARIALHDLEPEDQRHLPLFGRLARGYHRNSRWLISTNTSTAFAFIPGYKQHKFEEQDPINLEAVEIMSSLHDTLEAGGYSGHQLERFLVRVLFCLFAEDTGIFDREAFRLYLLNRTAEDGSDLGQHLARLFDVLNTPPEKRQKNLDETLASFQWVNGDLFAENLGFADFNRDMRNALLACTSFDWSCISPAIFGSLFQAVMEPKERRQIGGHYTNERDILKLIRSLFLDDLRVEFERAKRSKAELRRFHGKLSELRFLDPACGCGNFLVITYRELRLLEIEILKLLYSQTRQELNIQRLSLVDVDAFYGIEISEWPVRIAEVAMWLMDHQMNIRLSEAFGQYFVRLPLKKSPTIRCGNALRLDWKKILPPTKCSYILGNPPFVGKKEQTTEQKADMNLIFGSVKGAGVLDYVCGWYVKAGDFIQGTQIKAAFVSTNSITQGEQVGILWNELFKRFHLEIHFAHRTFAWESAARGKAHVHVVIIGFACFPVSSRTLFDYHDQDEEPVAFHAQNINPYLADAPNALILKRGHQIGGGPEISYGSMANDRRKRDKGLGNLILDAESRSVILKENPGLRPYIRQFVGSKEFLNSTQRWCIWLVDAPPAMIRTSANLRRRIEAVRVARLESGREETRSLAATPQLFGEIRQPKTKYLLIPKVSSETRPYMPVGFMEPEIIANGSALIIPKATLYHCGILSSAMHMAWMRYACGRLESRYQYSSQIVYNNFPWPEAPTAKQRAAVGAAARRVLDARKKFPDATLADLYDPLAMPTDLVKAHAALDRAVDLCYRPQRFQNDRQRVEHLFALYEKLTAPLIPPAKKRRRKTHSN